ncbi:MAG TPA: hypothetical protein VFB25_02530 [Gaiellaceae bacterium]|nr:hypothetical protein [Gaiellaceae bacterium]
MIVVAVAATALAAPALGRAASVQRPNPIFVSPQVDYVRPIESSTGGVAQLEPLDPAVIPQAIADQSALAYERLDDLGGFLPAPIGQLALSSGGHNVVGAGSGRTQIPQFAQAASGSVQSFAFTGGPTAPPQNGTNPVPGLGTPPHVVPPTNTNTVPPPNQGFGGNPPPATTTTGTTTSGPTTTTSAGGGGTTTSGQPPPTTTTAPPPTTTTVTTTPPTTTTTPTTTAAAGTTGSGGSSGGSPPPPSTTSCGTIGLSIESDHSTCRIVAVNMAPGGAASERMTITNTADQAFTLSLRAEGSQNHLWDELELGVWQAGTAAPSPLPALLLWTTQQNPLTVLQPGQSITYEIELYLPPTAGNDVQGLAATIDFNWEATA